MRRRAKEGFCLEDARENAHGVHLLGGSAVPLGPLQSQQPSVGDQLGPTGGIQPRAHAGADFISAACSPRAAPRGLTACPIRSLRSPRCDPHYSRTCPRNLACRPRTRAETTDFSTARIGAPGGMAPTGVGVQHRLGAPIRFGHKPDSSPGAENRPRPRRADKRRREKRRGPEDADKKKNPTRAGLGSRTEMNEQRLVFMELKGIEPSASRVRF